MQDKMKQPRNWGKSNSLSETMMIVINLRHWKKLSTDKKKVHHELQLVLSAL